MIAGCGLVIIWSLIEFAIMARAFWSSMRNRQNVSYLWAYIISPARALRLWTGFRWLRTDTSARGVYHNFCRVWLTWSLLIFHSRWQYFVIVIRGAVGRCDYIGLSAVWIDEVANNSYHQTSAVTRWIFIGIHFGNDFC